MNLAYRADLAHTDIDGLGLNECTIHRCQNGDGASWWILWFNVARETDGVADLFEVPINPGGGFSEGGPARGEDLGLHQDRTRHVAGLAEHQRARHGRASSGSASDVGIGVAPDARDRGRAGRRAVDALIRSPACRGC